MTTLPSDLDVARQLMSVRASVIEATHHVRSPKRSTRYRTTRNLIIAGAAIAALTAGAIIVLQDAARRSSTRTPGATRTASLDSKSRSASSANPARPPTRSSCARASGATTCSAGNRPRTPSPTATSPVPPLVACTSPDGIVAVFPREGSEQSDEDFCGALGLADWDSD